MASPARTAPASREDAELFPIRTVAGLTGVAPVTLRAWERRYGLVKPLRSVGGHRLYRRSDIDTIHRVVALLGKGIAIGQVRRSLAAAARRTGEASEAPWERYRERMIAAISQFDEDRLEDVYNEALSLYPSQLVTEKVLLPLLVELGRRWETAEGGVAEEHFFGVYLRNKLGARFHHRARLESGRKLLAACLPGEHHEVGLLLFALAAHERGMRLVLLGADTPLGEIPYAARRSRADGIVLSGSIEPRPGLLDEELPKLVREAGVPVFVGGQTAVRHRDAIVAAGAEALGTDIAAGLKRIALALGAAGRSR
ncbi:MAG: MerR family transcriptional regulator [Burkholderiales bacterium]|nr:MerR family transcriptional regulator [Burkholderiales bacterium]